MEGDSKGPSALADLLPLLRELEEGRGLGYPNFTIYRRVEIEIVARNDKAEGFEVLSQRWIVERTFAWYLFIRQKGKGDRSRLTTASVSSLVPFLCLLTDLAAFSLYPSDLFLWICLEVGTETGSIY